MFLSNTVAPAVESLSWQGFRNPTMFKMSMDSLQRWVSFGLQDAAARILIKLGESANTENITQVTYFGKNLSPICLSLVALS